ncbi:MAG: type II toxin-antitoxin system VapC family toxin [Candidatus Diapherotrites archaeon]|uniref:Type II toxin-antitoxin system VapC family toxin n=1 Tax=Candidatus Iainarchaeum sp. TaxID=3101447 RepID=A0A8T4KPN7_9ARCH|nr:type II toxin-antitoxin system VapC family toxin [Candidatus Diapherotrites archaeon]
MIVFDTYAWIEYFAGSKKGVKVKEIVESTEQIVTPAIVLAEIKSSYLKEGKDFASRISFISGRSSIAALNKEISLLAAELKHKHRLYLVDAIVYATAQSMNAKLLTGDLHFKDLELIEFL